MTSLVTGANERPVTGQWSSALTMALRFRRCGADRMDQGRPGRSAADRPGTRRREAAGARGRLGQLGQLGRRARRPHGSYVAQSPPTAHRLAGPFPLHRRYFQIFIDGCPMWRSLPGFTGFYRVLLGFTEYWTKFSRWLPELRDFQAPVPARVPVLVPVPRLWTRTICPRRQTKKKTMATKKPRNEMHPRRWNREQNCVSSARRQVSAHPH